MRAHKSLLEKDIDEVILTQEQIEARVREMAAEIEQDYLGKEFLMVGVLNGAAVFYIDLMMALDIPLEMNFIRVSSYGTGTKTSGNVRILYDLEADITNKHVLIVEDIIDSGNTLKALKELLLKRGAAEVKSCCMMDKKERREADVEADYVGFEVPDKFLVGYGLDYAGKYRNLKFVGTLKPEVYMS
ncbi:MAG: hypoxanthine phosphoribosyltransferase [Christensenellaceae bacterium]|jgi:hypoxanthine phosphoribosyltransferase